MMRVYGLIGSQLGHSFSPDYFAHKFQSENLESECRYETWETKDPLALIEELKERPEVLGANVTFPYKQQIIPALDGLNTHAQAIGSVNTIVFDRRKSKVYAIGFNTDWWGFDESLFHDLCWDRMPTHALIIGNGGAAQAVKYALSKRRIDTYTLARNPRKGEWALSAFETHLVDGSLIVQCTPLGTAPDVESAPDLNYSIINSSHLLFDLVYNPTETTFLKWGKKARARSTNGLHMLHYQADKSWKIWNSRSN